MYNLELRPKSKHFWNGHSLLDRELDKFFDTFDKTENIHAPLCEIVDEEKHFAISLDIPGLKQEDISIEVKDQNLYVTGERKTVNQTKENVLRTERRYGKFSRVFSLPQNINTEAIEAKFENGVLDIVLPKEQKTQTRKISISNFQ